MITPVESQLIDQWVSEQMGRPWPLTSVQIELIKRTLRSSRKPTPEAAPAA